MVKVTCSICGQPMQGQGPKDWPHFPFCSKRCRLIDLGRWLGEKYRLSSPAEEEPSADCESQNTP